MTSVSQLTRLIKLDPSNRAIPIKVYGFYSLIWPQVVEAFRKEDLVLTGGSSTKRHIISPVHFELFNVCKDIGITRYDISEVWSNPVDLRMNVTLRRQPVAQIIDQTVLSEILMTNNALTQALNEVFEEGTEKVIKTKSNDTTEIVGESSSELIDE